ncbi:hypothetical protein ACTXT7_004972 [Hymenolepis weldensis]
MNNSVLPKFKQGPPFNVSNHDKRCQIVGMRTNHSRLLNIEVSDRTTDVKFASGAAADGCGREMNLTYLVLTVTASSAVTPSYHSDIVSSPAHYPCQCSDLQYQQYKDNLYSYGIASVWLIKFLRVTVLLSYLSLPESESTVISSSI